MQSQHPNPSLAGDCIWEYGRNLVEVVANASNGPENQLNPGCKPAMQ